MAQLGALHQGDLHKSGSESFGGNKGSFKQRDIVTASVVLEEVFLQQLGERGGRGSRENQWFIRHEPLRSSLQGFRKPAPRVGQGTWISSEAPRVPEKQKRHVTFDDAPPLLHWVDSKKCYDRTYREKSYNEQQMQTMHDEVAMLNAELFPHRPSSSHLLLTHHGSEPIHQAASNQPGRKKALWERLLHWLSKLACSR